MTALVAVMNKQAVALAADSAGTVQLPGREHHKIYAMKKVFALSKTEPVGDRRAPHKYSSRYAMPTDR